MRLSTEELDKAIKWHETTIKETKDFLNDDDDISDELFDELWEQMEVCETSLATLQSIKERGGFI